LTKRQWILGVVVLLALLVLFIWARHHISFDFPQFEAQLRMADWRRIALGFAFIYAAYIFRSARWAALMRHNKKVPSLSLAGTQFMGFTAVALIGRIADLVRPYLVARKTKTEVSAQMAVYVVERLSDMGSIALFLSVALLSIRENDIAKAIHSNHFLTLLSGRISPRIAAFFFRYGSLILTVAGALFLVGIRVGGEFIARVFEIAFGFASKNLGLAAGQKIRTFHTGLDTIRSFADFSVLAVLSLSMWALIAAAYYESMVAFKASPQLAAISPSKAVFLMAASGAASVFQLPVLGWFSQIGLVAAAIVGFFGAAPEASTACAATILLVTFLSVIPVGLVWAQFDHVNLRRVAVESEHAGEKLSPGAEPLG